jgi:hypothetical protein
VATALVSPKSADPGIPNAKKEAGTLNVQPHRTPIQSSAFHKNRI